MILTPQPFIVREECTKAAHKNGFRHDLGEKDGWLGFSSTTASGSVYLAAETIHGPWFLALDHEGVVAELGITMTDMPGPGVARYALSDLGLLYRALDRVYALGVSLPDAPLREFNKLTEKLPLTTEAERLVVQRIGQDLFRKGLMKYWQGRCPLTGITDPALLRASHLIPWAECKTDAERLNVHNGLLLSALWDAAFDKALVSFADDGTPMFSPGLSNAAHDELRWTAPIPLKDAHRARLAQHRARLLAGG